MKQCLLNDQTFYNVHARDMLEPIQQVRLQWRC